MKIKSLYIILFTGILYSCKVSFHAPTEAIGFNIEPSTKSFVLIDGGITTTPGLAIKKKREGVVKEVKNQYLVMLGTALQKQLNLTCITDSTITTEEKTALLKKDPVAITSLSNRHNAAIVLILKDCYSGFRQGEVKKVSNWDGSNAAKIAEYFVFFDTEWIILQGSTLNEKTVSASKFHSDRSIQSGLLARGPGFAANKNDILEMAQQNAFNVSILFKY